MNSKTYAIANEIEHETEKAILVSANGKLWLPKSQVTVRNIDGIIVIELPTWLWRKNSGTLSITTTAENISMAA